MTAPIPFSSSPSHPPSPPATAPAHISHTPNPSGSSSSTIYSSPGGPQTPFSPSYTLPTTAPANTNAMPKINTNVNAGANPNSSILKWASSFGSRGKSPTSPTILGDPTNPFSSSTTAAAAADDHESHDAFEFGDISDLHRSSWTGHTRRTASMSQASGPGQGTAQQGQGRISAMLAGLGNGVSGKDGAGVGVGAGNVQVGSPPGGGVIAENVAKGQGLLRRLSLGGASRGRPQLTSPTNPQTSLPPLTSTSQTPMPTSVPAPQPTPAAPPTNGLLSPSAAGAPAQGFVQRGRRYSENVAGKKRGVSPMGERILRDHGHF